MHELGLTNAIIRTTEETLKENGMSGANRITLEIGEFSGVIPRFLESCWKAVIIDTKFAETQLIIEKVPGILRCETCREEFPVPSGALRCPKCDSDKLTPIAGMDMIIKQIEAY